MHNFEHNFNLDCKKNNVFDCQNTYHDNCKRKHCVGSMMVILAI